MAPRCGIPAPRLSWPGGGPGLRYASRSQRGPLGPNARESHEGGNAMSVTAPAGFRAAGVAAGLKPSGARDAPLVINDGPPPPPAARPTPHRPTPAPPLLTP